MNDLFKKPAEPSGPVECLGQTFASDATRREHYLAILREKLQDPAFRKTEGFPQGTDEAILAMSDPPYYTACPNPFLEEFVRHYGKPYDPSVKYSREPPNARAPVTVATPASARNGSVSHAAPSKRSTPLPLNAHGRPTPSSVT